MKAILLETNQRIMLDDKDFHFIVRNAEKLAETVEGVKFLAKIVRADPKWTDDNYTALHYALADSSVGRTKELRRFAENVILDPQKRRVAANTLTYDGFSAVQSAMNDEIAKRLMFTASGRAFMREIQVSNHGGYGKDTNAYEWYRSNFARKSK